jgi:hypothetical protein
MVHRPAAALSKTNPRIELHYAALCGRADGLCYHCKRVKALSPWLLLLLPPETPLQGWLFIPAPSLHCSFKENKFWVQKRQAHFRTRRFFKTVSKQRRLVILYCGLVMAQAVSRWPLTAEARVLARVSPYEIWGGQSRLSPNSSGFPLSVSFHRGSPYSYIAWGKNNKPIGGRSSETQSHPIDMNNNNYNVNSINTSSANIVARLWDGQLAVVSRQRHVSFCSHPYRPWNSVSLALSAGLKTAGAWN